MKKKKPQKESTKPIRSWEKPLEPIKKPEIEVKDYPAAGPRILEFERKLDEKLAEASVDPGHLKRGPGRPPKLPEPDPVQLTDVAIRGAVSLPFTMWSEVNKLPELSLTEREILLLADSTKALLDYYFPNLPAAALLWCNFTFAAVSILQPRLSAIKKERTKRKSFSSPSSNGQGLVNPTNLTNKTPVPDPVIPIKTTQFPSEIKTVEK